MLGHAVQIEDVPYSQIPAAQRSALSDRTKQPKAPYTDSAGGCCVATMIAVIIVPGPHRIFCYNESVE